MEADAVIEKIVSDLSAQGVGDSFAECLRGRYWSTRVEGICDLIFKVYRASSFRYLHGSYYYFTGKLYEQVEFRVFKYALRYFLRAMSVSDGDLRKNLDKCFLQSAYDAVWFNKMEVQHNLIAFTNCVYDLDTGISHKFSPEYGVIYSLGYAYDEDAECPMWEAFLHEVLPEQASCDIVQMFFGLGFVHRSLFPQKIEKCLMLVGQGGNGKGVVFETMSGVWGNHNISAMSLDSITRSGDEGMRNIAVIGGKKFNYCEEIQLGNLYRRSDALKAISSGEPQYGRVLRNNIYEVKEIPFLVFNMNKLPDFDDDTHGLIRRFLIVAFNVIIPKEMQNKQLSWDLKKEYAGIFNWLRKGFAKFKSAKYQFPLSQNGEKKTVTYIANNSPVVGYVYAKGFRSDPLPNMPMEAYTWYKSDVLYDDFLAFCDDEACNDCTAKGFAVKLRELGFERKRSNKGSYYRVYRDVRSDDSQASVGEVSFEENIAGII